MRLAISGLETLPALAEAARAAPQAATRAAYRTVNLVGAKIIVDAIRVVASEINLPVSYIRDRFVLRQANASNLVAIISAEIRPIGLERFGASQLTRKALRAKGDPRRRIAAGRKQAGVSVKVAKGGARKVMPGAFMMPMRAGKESGGNGMGLFIRTGKGPQGLVHKYGPSPSQLFRRYRDEKRPDHLKMLAEAFPAQLRYELTGRRK